MEKLIKTCQRKVKYAPSDDADKAVINVRKKWKLDHNSPCRKYYCRICGNYHITTMSRLQVAVVKSRDFEKERLEQLAEDWKRKKKWD